MTHLADLDATAQAELIRSKACSPSELLEETIAAIERVDPQLNAVVIPLFDGGARAADARGARRRPVSRRSDAAQGSRRGARRDARSTAGRACSATGGWISPHDSELTARFRRAGFVFVGKANTPELGLSPTTEPDTFGPTRNPWNTGRIVGGSSGGSAAAVAARMVAVAHAGDGGGSIRNPAGACGIAGLKPSRGRITLGPDIGEAWSGCVTEFVVARSVRDLATRPRLRPRGRSPAIPSSPRRRPDVMPRSSAVIPGRLRIGLFIGNASYPGGPDARAAVEGCGRLLASLGHHVHDGYPKDLDHDELGQLLGVSGRRLRRPRARRHRRAHRQARSARTASSLRPGPSPSAAARSRRPTYLANLDAMHRYSHRARPWWETNDLLVTPTMSEPPPEIGTLKGADIERIVRLVPYTSPYNVSGQPGIALPLHWTPEGLPLGIQLVAKQGAEDLLIRIASQIEAAAPWIDRRPPVCA